MAPVLLSYGKALFELGFSQQGVMGKEEVTKTADAGTFCVFICTLYVYRISLMGRRSKRRR
jgi:hypothetical protein